MNEASLKRVLVTWWPLAASWLLMAIELPALSAIVARLPEPEINLAAYGGVVFPIALIIESPIIMLLAASTALSKDLDSYNKIRRFMMTAGASLTALHALIAFTPLYYVVVEGVIGAPQEIVEPARLGLMIMLPWTWSIAYRRFNQGTLIRFGHSQTVGIGTVVRLASNGMVLGIGYALGEIPGIVVGASAVATGVTCEAIYVGLVKSRVLNRELKLAEAVDPPLSWGDFWAFYIPLVMTSLLSLLANPIGSAALSRMPQALASLAAWPVITGLVFMFRSLGIAFNEVVVALLDEAHTYNSLKRFTTILAATTTVVLLLITVTPLSQFWFESVSALSPELAEMARNGLWLALPLPALSVLQSWYQGAILYGRRTGGISESVVIYLATSAAVLVAGVLWGQATGLYIGMAALSLSVFTQTAWLWLRARPVLRKVESKEPEKVARTGY
ncbi:MAG: hypothetical protein JXA78_17830 [Anaerolineales bacterium]|nr:hypothetical protein [Anaerolineales bacterium]